MSDITTQLNGNLQTNEFSQVNEVRIAGYWLKDSCKPFVMKQINEEGNGILSCTVKGYVKKRNPEKELIIYAMDCPDIKCSKMVYSSGQHLYVNVVSACEGYISIWLEDVGEKKVYRLIQGRKIIQGKATVFFDSGDDEVLLNSEGEHEKGIHRLFVIRTKIQENYFHAAGKSYLWEGGLKSIIPDYMDSDKFIIQLLQKQLLCDDIEMKSVVINVIK